LPRAAFWRPRCYSLKQTEDRGQPAGGDFSGLSPVKTRALLRLLRNHDCACGCGMKVAECRVQGFAMLVEQGLAAAMADAIRAARRE